MFTDPNGKWTGQGAEGSGLDILIAGGEHIHIPIKENSFTCQAYGKIVDYTTHLVVIKYYMCSRSFLTLIELFLIHITIMLTGLNPIILYALFLSITYAMLYS